MDRRLLESVKKHEGLRLKAYQDTIGVWTIGYGRNLQELEIDEQTAESWLIEDLMRAALEVERHPFFNRLDTLARKNVIYEMSFNLGYPRLKGFKKMWAAIELQDWKAASAEMLDSTWARQVGQRAITLADTMRNGTYGGDQ